MEPSRDDKGIITQKNPIPKILDIFIEKLVLFNKPK